MCSHIVGYDRLKFFPDCREFIYFRYMDLNANKTELSYKNKKPLVDDTRECDLSITGYITRY